MLELFIPMPVSPFKASVWPLSKEIHRLQSVQNVQSGNNSQCLNVIMEPGNLCFGLVPPTGDNCPSSRWNVMCRPCCEYHLIRCRCPSRGSSVGYTVPCCRNALDQCDPCIVHPGASSPPHTAHLPSFFLSFFLSKFGCVALFAVPGCSLFENCKTCHNGTWKANDDFFVNGKYCTDCRQGWSGGDCRSESHFYSAMLLTLSRHPFCRHIALFAADAARAAESLSRVQCSSSIASLTRFIFTAR